jgi:hypothetical protein
MYPIICTTHNQSLEEMVLQGTDALTRHAIVPAEYRTAHVQHLNQLLDVCASLAIADVEDLLARVTTVIKQVAQTHDLTTYKNRAETHAVHVSRNTLTTILAASRLSQHDAAFNFVHALPAVSRRAGGDRPLEHDEVTLLRLAATAASLAGGKRMIPAVQYALTDSGALPSETTRVTPRDFDHLRQPTSVKAPGVKNFTDARQITLGPWAQPILVRGLDQHAARGPMMGDQPIAYSGVATPGRASASASVSGNLKRLMRTSGMADPKVKPTSIDRWRVASTLQAEGIAAALAVHGRQSIDGVFKYAGLERPSIADLASPMGSFI